MTGLSDSNEALGGAIPRRILLSAGGDQIVHAELSAIEHGHPA
jgi:hypothetical protein